MSDQENKSRIQWQPIIELSIVLFTILGTTIPLYLHTDSKFEEGRKEFRLEREESRKETNAIVEAIRQDIQDFHGRLCAIEERGKGK